MKETEQIRKAEKKDIDAVAAIYAHIYEQERTGKATIGWLPGIYPIRGTAEAALARRALSVENTQPAARCCGWTRTRKMRRRADYIKSWAMPNRISCPAYLTEYQMYSWCCWKRS